jgi:tetratricopeptide (TPR) repeat protein
MPRYFYEKGTEAIAGKDYATAIALLGLEIRLDPENQLAWANRGYAHLHIGEREKALADCTEAIRLDPQDPVAHRGRAEARRALGDQAGAAEDERNGQALARPPAWVAAPGAVVPYSQPKLSWIARALRSIWSALSRLPRVRHRRLKP